MRTIIEEIEKSDSGQLRVLVVFTDDQSIKVREWVTVGASNLESLKQQLRNRADSIKNAFDFANTLSKGELDLTPAQPVDVKLNDAQLYLQGIEMAGHIVRAIALGVKADSDADYTAAIEFLKKNYQDSYLTLF